MNTACTAAVALPKRTCAASASVGRVNGSVDIQRTPGFGTSFKIKIPLTLAIAPALVLVCAGERIANPQVSLSEAVLAEKSSAATSVLRGDCAAGDGAADAAAGALNFRLEIYVVYGAAERWRKK